MKLTQRVCDELKKGDGTAYEIAAELDVDPAKVSATVSNLKRAGHIAVVAQSGRSAIVRFVSDPTYGVRRPGSGRKAWADYTWLTWLPLSSVELAKRLGITRAQASNKLNWARMQGKVKLKRVAPVWELVR